VAGRVRDPNKEVWKIIPSLPGIIASSHGRLMVVPYYGDLPQNRGQRQYGGEPTYGQWDGARFIYPIESKTHKVARLICEAFHGPQPFPEAVVMHLDENSRNNKPKNLAWGTQKENMNAPGYIAYCKSRTGENSPHAKWRASLSSGVES